MGIASYSSLLTGTIRHIIVIAMLLASMGLTGRIEAASFTLVTGNVVDPAVVSGATETLNALVQSASGASGVNVTLQILDASGVLVARKDYLSQNFTAGQQVNYSWSYVIPPSFPAGTYTLAVGVFSSDWATTYLWNGTVEAFMSGTGLNTITADDSYYQGSTAYWALQNAWGRANNPGGQDITVDPSAFQGNTLVRWTWPVVANNTTPRGAPEIVFGFQAGCLKPGGGMASPNGVTPVPTQIKSFAQLSGAFDIAIGAPDLEGFDILWETWTVSAATNGTRTGEIAILLHAPQHLRTWVQSLSFVGSYTGPGISGMVYQTTDSSNVPYVILLLNGGDFLKGNIDLLDYLKFVASKGIISTNDWMTDYEFAAEPFSGVGYYKVNNLNYTWSPNGTPSITSPLAAGGTVNQPFSYQIAASNGPTSYGASGLPAGLSVNTSTGLISGTSTTIGTTSVTISGTNSSGTGSATLQITLSSAASPPAITSALTASGVVGQTFTYQIAGSNTPTSYNATGLPAGLTVDTGTGAITGTPTTSATTNVTISATNGSGTGSATLVITIASGGSGGGSVIAIDAGGPAVGSFLADQDFSGGSTYTVTNAIDVSATNAAPAAVYQSQREHAFTYTIPGLTAGGSYTVRLHFSELYFGNAGARVFNVGINGAPALTNFDIIQQAGGVQYKAVVRDCAATADGSGQLVIAFTAVTDNPAVSGIEIRTAAGAAPAITGTLTATGTVGQALAYQITGSNTPTSFNATGLPAGLSIDTGTGVIAGTPTVAGTTNVTISATNGSGTGSATLVITVSAAASHPVITSSLTATATVGQAFTYQIAGSNSPTSFNATGLPAGLNVNTATGAITGTPTVAGATNVTISATNGSGTGSATLALTVSATGSAPGITSALTATATVGQAFTYQITATHSPTSFAASNLPAGLTVNALTGVISGTPTVAGASNVGISAINGNGTGGATLAITVANSSLGTYPPTANSDTGYKHKKCGFGAAFTLLLLGFLSTWYCRFRSG